MQPYIRTLGVLGRIGETARGIIFCAIGSGIIWAALRLNAAEVHGFAGALQSLRAAPWGPSLMTTVCVGLGSFGVYLILSAPYQKL